MTGPIDALLDRRPGGGPVIRLFGAPRITAAGRELPLPGGGRRLLAYLAVRTEPVTRERVAGALWPGVDRRRAVGNLRSALWRLRLADVDVVSCDRDRLALRDGVVADVRVVEGWAARVTARRPGPLDLAPPRAAEVLDLLPGWYDDWVLAERDRVREAVLAALEALSRQLTARGRGADAVRAAMVAVAADPLREGARRALIEAQLAEGNWDEARRALLAYRAVLRAELGVDPHPSLVALVRDRRAAARRAAA